MIRFLLILSLVSGCFTLESIAQDLPEHSRHDSLGTGILINPNDLLHAVPDWSAATTDGFTYRVDTGLYGFYGPQPTIYLDGIPVDFSYFNWQNLNMLPYSTEQISSISYRSDPGVAHHALSRAGYLNLHTVQPDSGFNIYGSFTVGNQIEDPGPWSYDTSRVTPNIDRRGPHYFTGFAYRSSAWYARGQFSLRQHQPTNLNTNHRIGSYSYVDEVWHAVKTTVNSGLAEAGYQSSNWKLKTRALWSNNEEYLFFQPFGREIPAITGYRQFALQADRSSRSWTFSSRYAAQQKQIDYRLNNKNYNFDWRRLDHTFSLSAAYRQNGTRLKSGALFEMSHIRGLQMSNRQLTAILFGSVSSRLHRHHMLAADFNVDIAARETGSSFSIGSEHQVMEDWNLSTDANYTELLYYRQQSSTYWQKRGYDLYSQLNIGHISPFSSKKNRSAGVRVTNTVQLSPSASLTLEGRYIHHYAINIPWQVVNHDELQHTGIYTRPGNFEFTSEYGDRLHFKIGFSQDINQGLSHEFNALMQYTADGTRRYRYYWQQSPQHRLVYAFMIRPATDLSFSLNASYRGATRWNEYQNIEGERYRSLQPQYPLQYGTFHTRTPSFLKIDLTTKKWFWDRRLATAFSVRNLLNTEVRYHTLGLDQALKFIIKVSLSL